MLVRCSRGSRGGRGHGRQRATSDAVHDTLSHARVRSLGEGGCEDSQMWIEAQIEVVFLDRTEPSPPNIMADLAKRCKQRLSGSLDTRVKGFRVR
jgi:hypothetical protein